MASGCKLLSNQSFELGGGYSVYGSGLLEITSSKYCILQMNQHALGLMVI